MSILREEKVKYIVIDELLCKNKYALRRDTQNDMCMFIDLRVSEYEIREKIDEKIWYELKNDSLPKLGGKSLIREGRIPLRNLWIYGGMIEARL